MNIEIGGHMNSVIALPMYMVEIHRTMDLVENKHVLAIV